MKSALLLSTVTAASAGFVSVGLGRTVVDLPPRSRFMSMYGGNGSNIPAGGAVWPTAIFWAMVQVGTPPVDVPVAIDSGSGDLDISGVGCVGCVTTPPNVAYDPAASSSSKPATPSTFSNTYQTCDLSDPTAPCTIAGNLYKESVSLAGLGPVDVVLGSIQKQTSNFDQFKEVDGVMGFTGGGNKNVFAQLVASNKCDNVYAFCINEGAKSNGTLTIGGVDPRLSVGGQMDYVPDAGAGFRAVQVASLTLGNGTAFDPFPKGFNSGKAILDTGTNVLLLPDKALAALQQRMCADAGLASCTALWGNKCVDLTEAQVDAYPSLSLNLAGGLPLRMSSRDYLLRGSPQASAAGQYCLAIRSGGTAGGSGFLIGDTTMRNYYLVFDLANKRIGWGPVDKANCGNI